MRDITARKPISSFISRESKEGGASCTRVEEKRFIGEEAAEDGAGQLGPHYEGIFVQ